MKLWVCNNFLADFFVYAGWKSFTQWTCCYFSWRFVSFIVPWRWGLAFLWHCLFIEVSSLFLVCITILWLQLHEEKKNADYIPSQNLYMLKAATLLFWPFIYIRIFRLYCLVTYLHALSFLPSLPLFFLLWNNLQVTFWFVLPFAPYSWQWLEEHLMNLK